MTPAEYRAALIAAGMPGDLQAPDMDRWVAALFYVDVRTARRWRRGESAIPGPVEVALQCLGRKEPT